MGRFQPTQTITSCSSIYEARKAKYSYLRTRKNLHACVKQSLWVINPSFCRHAAQDHVWVLSSGQCAAFLSPLFPDHSVMRHLWDTHSTQWRKQRDGHVWKGHTTGIAGYAAPCACPAWGSTGDLRLNASAEGTLWKGCSTKPCCRSPSSQQQVDAELSTWVYIRQVLQAGPFTSVQGVH